MLLINPTSAGVIMLKTAKTAPEANPAVLIIEVDLSTRVVSNSVREDEQISANWPSVTVYGKLQLSEQ